MSVAPVIGLVAGEASGDLLGAHLVEALRARRPDLQFAGIAGPRMIAAGVQALYPMEKLAVRGYVEVLRHYLEIAGIRRKLLRHFLQHPPAVFIGIDAPDFNLGLEFKLKKAGIVTLQYVSPSIWAWRGERIHFIKRAVDRVLTIFPFEKAIYDKAGVCASYVGHPLADMLADYPAQTTVRASLGLQGDAPVIALLPGSRVGELNAMAELFVATARRITAAVANARFVTPLVNRETRALFETALRHAPGLHVQLLDGQSHDAIAAADIVLVASGTATLEAALLKRPMVIAYRVPWLTAWIMRRRAYVPYLGLPNILAGEFVVPEFVQEAATPEALARALIDLLHDVPRRTRISERFAHLLGDLRQNAAQKAADAIMPYLEENAVTHLRIAGVDEAGRGPLAGPVYAAAVILDPAKPIAGLADSKTLSAKRREVLFDLIQRHAESWAIASASVEEIDTINILQASLLAMRRAVEGLAEQPDKIIVDGLHCPKVRMPAHAIVKGDAKEPAISAASILAKVARDREMQTLHQKYPHYGFDAHKGYGTAAHMAALQAHGVSSIHRRSYAPIEKLLLKNK